MNLYKGLDIDLNDEAFAQNTKMLQKNIEESCVWRSLRREKLWEWIRVLNERIEDAKSMRWLLRSKHKKNLNTLEMKQAKIIMKKLKELNKRQQEQLKKVKVAVWMFFLQLGLAASCLMDHIFCIKMRSFNEQALNHRLKTMQNIAFAYVFRLKARRNNVKHTPYASMMIMDM